MNARKEAIGLMLAIVHQSERHYGDDLRFIKEVGTRIGADASYQPTEWEMARLRQIEDYLPEPIGAMKFWRGLICATAYVTMAVILVLTWGY